MAKLIIRKGMHNEKRYEIDEHVYVGRSRSQRAEIHEFFINIPDTQMSRQHTRIFEEDSRFYIDDLNSTNGTFLNNQKITPGKTYPLKHRDSILVGTSQFMFFNPAEVNERLSDDLLDVGTVMKTGHSDIDIKITSDDKHELNVSKILDAQELLSNLQKKHEGERNQQETIRRLQTMSQLSIALGAETNRDKVVSIIIDSLFSIFPTIERVFIGLTDKSGNELIPLVASNRNKLLPTTEISISKTIMCEVIQNKKSLLLLDAMNDERYKENASVVDLSIRSVMCVPLIYKGAVLGILQVDTHSAPQVFQEDDLEVLTGISAQIAISVKNAQLHENIEQLFEGFVTASVQAIEDRDPVTAGHSFRVADYTCNLAEAISKSNSPALRELNFSREQMREIRYASLLHDFGKVGVREEVLQKSKKLYPHELDAIKLRFNYACACLQSQAYQELANRHESESMSAIEFRDCRRQLEHELSTEQERLNVFLNNIIRCNEPAVEYEDISGELNDVSQFSFINHLNKEQKIITGFEFSALELSHGSLTPEERIDIETHVSHTFAFLNLIPWTESLEKVPEIAHAHHEKLDGTGYPQRLQAEDIPMQSRIMSIADIYDALTAVDRPYKNSLPADKALDLMRHEVKQGKLDEHLFKVFVDASIYKID